MARRRVIDWRKLSRNLKGQPWHFKLTWCGVLANADGYGLCYHSPLQIGQAFMEEEINAGKISLRQIGQNLEALASGDDPRMLTWEHQGQQFIAVPKWQDYQSIRLTENADCPLPPAETFWRLSEKTRCLLCAGVMLGQFTAFSEEALAEQIRSFERNAVVPATGQSTVALQKLYVSFAPEGEEREKREGEGEVKAERAAPAACSWCDRPTDPDGDKPEPQRLAQIYHNAYREAHSDCPVIGSAEFGALGRMLSEKPFARIAAVLRHGVCSQDPYLVKRGHSLLDLLSKANFQGIAQALDAGVPHGGAPGARPRGGTLAPGKDVAGSWRR